MEGSLHVLRQKIISNKALLSYTSRVGVPTYIQSKMFTLKAWHPPHFHVAPPPRRTNIGQDNGDKINVAEREGAQACPTTEGSTATQKDGLPQAPDASQPSSKSPNTSPVDAPTPADGDVESSNLPIEGEADDAMLEDEGPSIQDPAQVTRPEKTADDAMVEDETAVQANGTNNDQTNDDAMIQDDSVEDDRTVPNGVSKSAQSMKGKPPNEGKRKAKPKKKKGQDEQATQVLGDKVAFISDLLKT